MCSTTRAALLTGRNHHSVGVGCLANFDSGYPGYRGKIAREAGTLAEMLRPHGYRNYMVGKWHVTPLTRDRPARARSTAGRWGAASTATTASWTPRPTSTRRSWCATTPRRRRPGPSPSGYHLTDDLVDQSIRYIADHIADAARARRGCSWLALGRLPRAAPGAARPDPRATTRCSQHGWDVERERRLARQKALGIVPPDTRLPPRNDGVAAWDSYRRRRAAGLHPPAGAPSPAMLDHADQHLAG